MQTTSSKFQTILNNHVRKVSARVFASFDKAYDDAVEFFTIGVSSIGSGDMIAPNDADTVQGWDKYEYTEYTDRLLSSEITNQIDETSGVTSAFADITLNNYDDFFTPGSGSLVDGYVLPRRPFRLYGGFDTETLPLFVGLSDSIPEYDKDAKTVRFHLIDMLSEVLERDITESILLQDVNTDDVLDYLFQLVGLVPSQYSLDSGFNNVNFFFIESGKKMLDVVKDLMVAEQGRLYMDELGIIRFKNRQNYTDMAVHNFDKSNSIKAEDNGDPIVNQVKVKAHIMASDVYKMIYQSSSVITVPGNSSVDVWSDFSNPILSCDAPVFFIADAGYSFYTSSYRSDAYDYATSDDYITVNFTLFSKASKTTFTNSNVDTIYIIALQLWGVQIIESNIINLIEQDDLSIEKYGIYTEEIDSPYIQDIDSAIGRAKIRLYDLSEPGTTVKLTEIGNPALQISDGVDLNIDGYQDLYSILKIYEHYEVGNYTQELVVRQKDIIKYFQIGVSEIGGIDAIAP